MAPRSIASGTISFGLVSIPVKVFPATQPAASLTFNMLHAKDGARLKQQYVCAKDGEVVPREETVKGFEFSKDRYVTFSAEELRALDEIATQTIDIAEFVPASQVDPIYYDKAYYLGPDRGGAKAYRLLAEALAQSGKAALARYAARGKQYLVLIRPRSGRLVMQQLCYPDEVRSLDEIPVDTAEPREAEVQLALQLIEQSSSPAFHPERYEDAVRKRVLAAIEEKVNGGQIHATAPEEAHAQVIDLVDALRASLSAAKGVPAAEGSPAEQQRASRRPRRQGEGGRVASRK